MPPETPLTAETPQPASTTDAGTGQPQPAASSATATAEVPGTSPAVQVSLDRWRRMWPFKHQVGAWFASATLHATVLVLMCLLAQHVIKQLIPVDLSVHTISHDEPLVENLPNELPIATPHPKPGLPGAATASPEGDLFGSSLEDSPLGVPDFGGAPTPGVKVDVETRVDPLATAMLPQGGGVSWGQALGKGGGGLGGRSPERRAQLVGSGGGSAASEDAVERGLRWLLAHQHEDGSWHFRFRWPTVRQFMPQPGQRQIDHCRHCAGLVAVLRRRLHAQAGTVHRTSQQGAVLLGLANGRHEARRRFSKKGSNEAAFTPRDCRRLFCAKRTRCRKTRTCVRTRSRP